MNESQIIAERSFWKAHLLDTEHLLELVKDHPVMSISFAERVKELKEKLAALDLQISDKQNGSKY